MKWSLSLFTEVENQNVPSSWVFCKQTWIYQVIKIAQLISDVTKHKADFIIIITQQIVEIPEFLFCIILSISHMVVEEFGPTLIRLF